MLKKFSLQQLLFLCQHVGLGIQKVVAVSFILLLTTEITHIIEVCVPLYWKDHTTQSYKMWHEEWRKLMCLKLCTPKPVLGYYNEIFFNANTLAILSNFFPTLVKGMQFLFYNLFLPNVVLSKYSVSIF